MEGDDDAVDTATMVDPTQPAVYIVIPTDGGGKVANASIHEMGAILDANDVPYETIDEAKVFDLMAEEDYNKDATFILESFEGVSFAALSAQGRAIIGTPLVLNNHDDERSPLEMQHRVQFSGKMYGVKVYFATQVQESIAGYGTLIAELKTRVQHMGGEWVAEYSPEVDIVVTDTVGPTATDHKAASKPVLLTAWVEEAWRLLLQDKLGDIAGTYKSNGLQMMQGTVILIDPECWPRGSKANSGSDLLKNMCSAYGADFTEELTEKATHYVTNIRNPQSEKALQMGMKVVKASWLAQSATNKYCMPEDKFSLFEATPAPSPRSEEVASPQTRETKRQRLDVAGGLSVMLTSSPARLTLPDNAVVPAEPATPKQNSVPTCFEFSTPAGMMTPKIMIMSSSPAVGETGSPAVRDSVKRKREAIFFDDSVPSSPNGVGNSLNKSAVDMVTDVKVMMKTEKRRMQADEMMKKEESYLADLTTVTVHFLSTLKDEEFGLNKVQLAQLFSNVADIKPVVEHLVLTMNNILEGWDPEGTTSFAGLFAGPFVCATSKVSANTTKEYLRTVYRRYIAGHNQSKDFYDEIMTSKKYQAAQDEIRRLEADPRCHRQRLVDLLMLPVQHLMRYPMHIENLMKSAPDGHPDKLTLKAELDFFAEATSIVNTAQARHETTTELFAFLQKIQDASPDCFVQGRKNIAGLPCKMQSKVPDTRPTKAMVFLMNDSLIVCERLDGAKAAKIKGTISRKAGRPIVANIFGNVKFQALYLLKGVQIYEGNVSEGLHWFTIAGIDHEDEDGDLEEGNDLGHFCVKSEHFDDYKGFLASCRKARLDQNLELTLDETKDAEQTEIQRLSAAAAAEAAESTIEFHGSGDAFASDCSDKENAQETMFTPKGKNRRKSFFQNSVMGLTSAMKKKARGITHKAGKMMTRTPSKINLRDGVGEDEFKTPRVPKRNNKHKAPGSNLGRSKSMNENDMQRPEDIRPSIQRSDSCGQADIGASIPMLDLAS